MADALSGNKADWASWANSVLNELQKVLLRAIMVKYNLNQLGIVAGLVRWEDVW